MRLRNQVFATALAAICFSAGAFFGCSSIADDSSSASRASGTGAGGSITTAVGASGNAGDASGVGGSGVEGGASGAGGVSVGNDASSSGPDAATQDSGANDGPSGGPRVVLLLYGSETNPRDYAPRDGMKEVLESMAASHGVVVDMQEDVKTTTATANGKALIVISGNCKAFAPYDGQLAMKFKEVTIPIIVSKDPVGKDMGMVTNASATDPANDTQIRIVKSDDPMAAGLTGVITVFPSGSRLITGNPGPEATIIATTTTDNRAVIYAFAAGATMVNGYKAPAKRLGFFWHRPTGGTEDAKKLFRAAVDWALKPST